MADIEPNSWIFSGGSVRRNSTLNVDFSPADGETFFFTIRRLDGRSANCTLSREDARVLYERLGRVLMGA